MEENLLVLSAMILIALALNSPDALALETPTCVVLPLTMLRRRENLPVLVALKMLHIPALDAIALHTEALISPALHTEALDSPNCLLLKKLDTPALARPALHIPALPIKALDTPTCLALKRLNTRALGRPALHTPDLDTPIAAGTLPKTMGTPDLLILQVIMGTSWYMETVPPMPVVVADL